MRIIVALRNGLHMIVGCWPGDTPTPEALGPFELMDGRKVTDAVFVRKNERMAYFKEVE